MRIPKNIHPPDLIELITIEKAIQIHKGNKILKEIAENLEDEKNITFYWRNYTCTNVCSSSSIQLGNKSYILCK